MSEGVEQVELTAPWQAVKDAGGTPELLAPETGEVQGFNHVEAADTFPVHRSVRDTDVLDYSALVLPGGVVNADELRTVPAAVNFMQRIFETGEPGDRERAGVGHRLAEQLQPGMAVGFGGGRQQLPVSVEDLVVRAVGQQLSWLLNPQRLEVKEVFHTAENAAPAPVRRTARRGTRFALDRLPGQTRAGTVACQGGRRGFPPCFQDSRVRVRESVTASTTWPVITPDPAAQRNLPRFS